MPWDEHLPHGRHVKYRQQHSREHFAQWTMSPHCITTSPEVCTRTRKPSLEVAPTSTTLPQINRQTRKIADVLRFYFQFRSDKNCLFICQNVRITACKLHSTTGRSTILMSARESCERSFSVSLYLIYTIRMYGLTINRPTDRIIY